MVMDARTTGEGLLSGAPLEELPSGFGEQQSTVVCLRKIIWGFGLEMAKALQRM